MVVSGVPVSTVGHVLGHGNMESSKRYIALDTEKLRECCLDLGPMHNCREAFPDLDVLTWDIALSYLLVKLIFILGVERCCRFIGDNEQCIFI